MVETVEFLCLENLSAGLRQPTDPFGTRITDVGSMGMVYDGCRKLILIIFPIQKGPITFSNIPDLFPRLEYLELDLLEVPVVRLPCYVPLTKCVLLITPDRG